MRNVVRLTGCFLVLILGLAAAPCEAQAIAGAAPSPSSAQRVRSEAVTYARLGYGGIAGDQLYGAPAMGFGIRAEHDSVGIDVSFFNLQFNSPDNSSAASAGSLIKLEVLHVMNPSSDAAGYFGGGLGWGGTSFSGGGLSGPYASGSGLEGELTAGYELGRTTTVRFFAQADAALPFYKAVSYTYSRQGAVAITADRYVPSLVLSLGLGWRHGRH